MDKMKKWTNLKWTKNGHKWTKLKKLKKKKFF